MISPDLFTWSRNFDAVRLQGKCEKLQHFEAVLFFSIADFFPGAIATNGKIDKCGLLSQLFVCCVANYFIRRGAS